MSSTLSSFSYPGPMALAQTNAAGILPGDMPINDGQLQNAPSPQQSVPSYGGVAQTALPAAATLSSGSSPPGGWPKASSVSFGPPSSSILTLLQGLTGPSNIATPLPASTPSVSFVPNQTYADKNLAPEQYPLDSLDALAHAQSDAQRAGVISPGLAKYFLSNQLVENRPRDFAINAPATVNYPSPDTYAPIATKLGFVGSVQPGLQRTVYGMPYNDSLGFKGMTPQILADQARYSAMFLANKPGTTPEAKIAAWNGAGMGAQNHLNKVKTMYQALMENPSNAPLKQTYQSLLDAYNNPATMQGGAGP